MFGDLVEGGRVNITVVDDDLEFIVSAIPKPETKEERKARKAAAAKIVEEVIDVTENQDNQ